MDKFKKTILLFIWFSLFCNPVFAQYSVNNFRGPEIAHRTVVTTTDSETALPTDYTDGISTEGYSHVNIIYGLGEWTSSWTLTPLYWSNYQSAFIEGNKITVWNESSGASYESSGSMIIPVDQAPYTYIRVTAPCGTNPSINIRLQGITRNFDRELPEKNTQIIKAVIASGASQSNIINIGDYKCIDFYMPSGWTTANLSFLISPTYSGYNYETLEDDASSEVSVIAQDLSVISLDTNVVNMVAGKFIKIRSGTESTPVAQGAERIIYLILKR